MNAKRHMSLVAAMPCAICGESPVQVHHIREEQGMSQRASDFLTVPLCYEHHQGATGIHGMGRKAFERLHRRSELDLLATTISQLA